VRRLLATTATLAVLGTSVAAYAAEPVQLFTQEQLREDAHKTARTVMSTGGVPVTTVSDEPCVNGTAGGTAFACNGVDLLSFVPQSEFGGSAPLGNHPLGGVSDLWGWVDPATGDEYVILGKTNGTALFRVTDPTAPVFLGQLPNKSPGQLVWHDIKVHRNHAFIVSESAGHGMDVFDLTRLRGVDAPRTWSVDAHYPLAFSVHNIAINEETGYAYIVGGNNGLAAPDHCLSNLHMVDISNPKVPVFAGCSTTDEGGGLLGLGARLPESPVNYIHDTQCVVYRGPDADHRGRELCFNSSEDFLSVVDVSSKPFVTQLSQTPYPGVAYAHQGWLSADQRYFFLGDELDEEGSQPTRTLVFDVSDLEKPVLVAEHQGRTNSIDHNMYEKDGLLYQSNYSAGLAVLDVDGVPALAAGERDSLEVAFFDTYPAHDDAEFVGTWSNYPYFPSGTIAVSGIDEGLFLLKVQDDVLARSATGTPPAAGEQHGAQGLARAERATARR
jgi:choice-of-anchor B domain-containing protein